MLQSLKSMAMEVLTEFHVDRRSSTTAEHITEICSSMFARIWVVAKLERQWEAEMEKLGSSSTERWWMAVEREKVACGYCSSSSELSIADPDRICYNHGFLPQPELFHFECSELLLSGEALSSEACLLRSGLGVALGFVLPRRRRASKSAPPISRSKLTWIRILHPKPRSEFVSWIMDDLDVLGHDLVRSLGVLGCVLLCEIRNKLHSDSFLLRSTNNL